MQTDLALLAEVAAGARPALSLGRFQPESDVDHAACRARGVEVVRRPTGGRALLHGGDLTYSVALAKPSGPAGAVDAIYRFLASGIVEGLRRIGVAAAIAHHEGPAGPVCFASQQGADLRVGERKVCGSAQVHRDGAVLQHGSVLLRRLPFDETDLLRGTHDRARLQAATVTLAELDAPTDPHEVAAAVISGFADALDLSLTSTAGPEIGPGARHLVEVESGR